VNDVGFMQRCKRDCFWRSTPGLFSILKATSN